MTSRTMLHISVSLYILGFKAAASVFLAHGVTNKLLVHFALELMDRKGAADFKRMLNLLCWMLEKVISLQLSENMSVLFTVALPPSWV